MDFRTRRKNLIIMRFSGRFSMVVTPEESDLLTVICDSIVQHIDNIRCAAGRSIGIIIMQGKMGDYEDRFIISNAVQIGLKTVYLI